MRSLRPPASVAPDVEGVAVWGVMGPVQYECQSYQLCSIHDRVASLLTRLPLLGSPMVGLLPDALYTLDGLVLAAFAWTHGVAGLPYFVAMDTLPRLCISNQES